jgi:chromosome segregation ATPase
VLSKKDLIELVKKKNEMGKRMKGAEAERINAIRQHEEALSKLKQEKEALLGKEEEFKQDTASFQEDLAKISAMEDEMKIYRVKLGELNREKEELMATFESEKKAFDKSQKNIKVDLENEIVSLKKKIASTERDFDNEMERKEGAFKKRIDEVKSSTKEAMLRLTKEKEGIIVELKKENETLKREVEKLKDDIRVLEIEKL